MKFHQTTIKIACDSSDGVEMLDVPAFVNGNVAYHHPMGNLAGWNVTHIPSGCICGRANNVKNARRVAEIMKPFCDAVQETGEAAAQKMMDLPNFKAEFDKARALFYA